MKANPGLYAEQLTLPIKCSEYTELLIANTHFKRDNAREMMDKYFSSDTKVSLKSCILNNASYSTIHAAKERIKATHKLFIRAIALTES
jgi:divalent metal cation (Fe/Co/Zn/Cd) transporter